MGRPISISIPHELGAAEARRRIDGGFGRLEREIAAGIVQTEKRWEGEVMHFTARALGQTIAGRLTVLDKSIEMEIELPTILAVLADRIRGRVKQQGLLLLEKK